MELPEETKQGGDAKGSQGRADDDAKMASAKQADAKSKLSDRELF